MDWMPSRRELVAEIIAGLVGAAALAGVIWLNHNVTEFWPSVGVDLESAAAFGVTFLAAALIMRARQIAHASGDPSPWLATVIEADRNNLASKLILDRDSNRFSVGGLLGKVEQYIILWYRYQNISVFTLIVDPHLDGRVQFKGEVLTNQPYIDKPARPELEQGIAHGAFLDLAIKIPLTDTASRAIKTDIDNGQSIVLNLQQVTFTIRAKEDETIAPVRIRLYDETLDNSRLRTNLWENGAQIRNGIALADPTRKEPVRSQPRIYLDREDLKLLEREIRDSREMSAAWFTGSHAVNYNIFELEPLSLKYLILADPEGSYLEGLATAVGETRDSLVAKIRETTRQARAHHVKVVWYDGPITPLVIGESDAGSWVRLEAPIYFSAHRPGFRVYEADNPEFFKWCKASFDRMWEAGRDVLKAP